MQVEVVTICSIFCLVCRHWLKLFLSVFGLSQSPQKQIWILEACKNSCFVLKLSLCCLAREFTMNIGKHFSCCKISPLIIIFFFFSSSQVFLYFDVYCILLLSVMQLLLFWCTSAPYFLLRNWLNGELLG